MAAKASENEENETAKLARHRRKWRNSSDYRRTLEMASAKISSKT